MKAAEQTKTTEQKFLDVICELSCEGSIYATWCEVGPNGEEGFTLFDSWDDVKKAVCAYMEKYYPGKLDQVESSEGFAYEQVQHIVDDLPDDFEEPMDSISWDFADSVTICSECGCNAIQTEPTHMGWRPDFHVGDGFIACAECCEEHQEDFIEDYINDIQHRYVPDSMDPEACGFVRLGETYATPDHVLSTLLENEIEKGLQVVFTVHRQSIGNRTMVWVRWECKPSEERPLVHPADFEPLPRY